MFGKSAMRARALLTATAAIEGAVGTVLLISPSVLSSILLGAPLEVSNGLVLGRLAGAALLSLAAACWLVRDLEDGRERGGLVGAMFLYNVAAVAILAHAGLGPGPVGIALWPAVILHVVLALWCSSEFFASGRSRRAALPIR